VVRAEPSASMSVCNDAPVVVASTNAEPSAPASDIAKGEDTERLPQDPAEVPALPACVVSQDVAVEIAVASHEEEELTQEETPAKAVIATSEGIVYESRAALLPDSRASSASIAMRTVTSPVATLENAAAGTRPCSRSVSPVVPPRSAGEAAPPMPHMMLPRQRFWQGAVASSLPDSTQALSLTVEMATTLVAELSQLVLASTTTATVEGHAKSTTPADRAAMQRALNMVAQMDDAIGKAINKCCAEREENNRLLEVHRLSSQS